ncbi:hypothetical protein GDO81_007164 [Engystomops pustulosus]|uniref:Uncharacterized protein n=1 Tax=Engystomops pustulosus TaxID=76066 RepID=A0AAV7C6W4_ENGPU|nr:hypothetical protein GDO81_007164 [Engystomops pustulosus]
MLKCTFFNTETSASLHKLTDHGRRLCHTTKSLYNFLYKGLKPLHGGYGLEGFLRCSKLFKQTNLISQVTTSSPSYEWMGR